MPRSINKSRHGLVLLMVLIMLALFSLLVVTYVIFSSDSRDASLILAKSDFRAPRPNSSSDEVVKLLIRGTSNTQNSLYRHDLLRDLCGENSLPATVDGAEIVNSNFLVVKVSFSPSVVPASVLSQIIPGTFAGRVLTFQSGPLTGSSYNIISHNVNVITGAGTPVFEQLLAVDCGDLSSTTNAVFLNNSVLINDKVFDGHGSYSATVTNSANVQSTVNDLGSKRIPLPFLVNHPLLLNNFGLRSATYNGQPDESFDVADYNDMYLAHSFTGSNEDNIPSFHRPELLQYLAGRYDLGTGSISRSDLLELLGVLEAATLRPLSYDITWSGGGVAKRNKYWRQGVLVSGGSNAPVRLPTLDLDLGNATTITDPVIIQKIQAFLNFHCLGPWDVDTDGDLRNDAIWIDPGLAMQIAPNGRLLKVLAGVQILPLDGRLDLNAVGAGWQGDTVSTVTPTSLPWMNALALRNNRELTQGVGLGPAEIGIRHLFQNQTSLDSFFKVRYSPNNGANSANQLAPGVVGDDTASQYRQLEQRNEHRHYGLPGFPRDLRGRHALAIDKHGSIVTINVQDSSGTTPNEWDDDPYESRVLTGAHSDSSFSLAEMERVMRRSDPDYAMLPNRLENTLVESGGPLSAASDVRRSITTRSSSINTIAPGFTYQTAATDHPVYDWLSNYLQSQSKPGYQLRPQAFQALFPIEFRTGQKLDLNRLLGNGQEDDISNGEIDEPTELVREWGGDFPVTFALYLRGKYPYGPGAPLLDRAVSNAGPVLFTGMETRQLLARELYCLLQALVPYDYIFPGTPRATPNASVNSSDLAVRAYRARRLAQWAVNIVDFRDADSACTRFVYDIEPFNASTWNLSDPNETAIVWGMEQPELLLTENINFHDKRIKDTKIGSDERVEQGSERDPDLDQYRIPQGTSIFELFVPRTTAPSANGVAQGVSGNLYALEPNSGQMALNLGAFAPSDGTHQAQPVWRLAISEIQPQGQNNTPDEIYRDPTRRGNFAYQPTPALEASINGLYYDYSDSGNPPPAASLERFVYFSTTVPNEIPMNGSWQPSADHAYWNKTTNTLARGGQYVVVAPRIRTHVGSLKTNISPPVNRPSLQEIDVDPAGFLARLTGIDGAPKTSTDLMPVKSVVPMIATGELPTAQNNLWRTAFPNGLGVSISEPLPGNGYASVYRLPTKQLNSSDTNAQNTGFGDLRPDSYYDYADQTGAFPDKPFDKEDNPVFDSVSLATGTTPNVRTVYLQRLADPTRPYHPEFNPYIAFDWMAMDLTVFNGEDDVDDRLSIMNGQMIDRDPDDPAVVAQSRRLRFGTRYRGNSTALDTYFTYDSQLPANTVAAPPVNGMPPPPRPYFPFEVSRNTNGLTEATIGFANVGSQLNLLQTPYAGYEGVLASEFCSLPWYNRSFSSPMELALVPMSGPGQLHQEFTKAGSLGNLQDWYRTSSTFDIYPFGHLAPFFSSSTQNDVGADLVQLLTFVEVTPPWAEYYKTVDPTGLQSSLASARAEYRETLAIFAGPYSQVPLYRSAGKVNVNAIAEPNVWRGLESNGLSAAERGNSGASGLEYWTKFLDTRTGITGFPAPGGGTNPFAGVSTTIPTFDYQYPTRFAGAYKDPGQSALTPATFLGRPKSEVSFLRSNRSSTFEPLFVHNPATSPFDPTKHPHVLYQDISRFSNLTTSHSNVFAVWITLGYFEYSEDDGILQEYKASTGENKRHRSFYIIDRSIPVGYSPGKDLNVEETILIRRYME